MVSAITFSTLGLFAKLAYAEGMAPTQALAWRFGVASIGLWILLLRKNGQRRPWRDYRDILLLGLLGFTPQAGLYFLAIQYREPRLYQLLALILSTTGCVLTLWVRGQYPAIGYFFGLAVAVSYAAYLVVGERIMARLDPVFATTLIISSAAVVYWILTFATGTFLLPATAPSVAGVLGIAVFGTIVPIITLFAAISLIGSSETALVSTIEPLFTVAFSALLLGERLTGLQLAGGAFIVAGVVVLNIRFGKPTIA